MLLVSHGSLELRNESGVTNLGEGAAIALPLSQSEELWPSQAANVVLFERRDR